MWNINSGNQALTFLIAIIEGMIFCVLYDLLRALRENFKYGTAAVFLQDVFYWIVIGFTNFCLFILRCSGEIRGYVFIGILLGWLIFRITLSGFLVLILVSIIKSIRFIIIKILKPIKAFLSMIFKIFGYFLKILVKFLGKTIKTIKKGLKQAFNVVYNLTRKKKIRMDVRNEESC